MNKKDKLPKYEPPVARDLSGAIVQGVSPGACAKGGVPGAPGCKAGSVPAACLSGATP